MSPCPERSCFRLSARRLITELLLGSVLAAAASVVLQAPLARFGLSEPTELPDVAASTSAAVVLAALFLAVLRWRRGPLPLMLAATWTALSALATLVLAWPLQSTRWYYGGASVDQLFRLQFLTRLTDSPALADMNYPDLPPFYPAGWFWVGGRFAELAGMPAWVAFKPFALLTVAVTSVGAFTLWSAVVRRRVAVLLAVSTTLSGFLLGVDEPYAWISAAWLCPVAVAAWYALGCREHRHTVALVGIGSFLGLAAVTYTLNLAFATAVVVVIAVTLAVPRFRSGDRHAAWRPLLRLLPTGAVAAAVALLVWTPYLLTVLGGAPSQSGAANRYLPAESALPLPMFEPSLFGALCLLGLGWAALAARRDRVAAGLLVLIGTVYLWFALSTVTIAAHTTLLAFRILPTLNAALAAAGVLALLELRGALARFAAREGMLARATALALVLGIGGSTALTQTALATSLSEAAKPAYADYYPDGSNSLRQADPATPGAYNDDLVGAIDELTGREPSELVLLTTYYPILSFAPYWGFQQETVHYANPLAEFNARADEVRRWSTATTPQQLRTMWTESRFRPPDVLVLRRAEDGWYLTLSHDAFPHQPNVQVFDVRFDPAAFASLPTRNVGPFVVVASEGR